MILYLPVETVARELDAKLLLALCALRHGMRVVIGNRALMNLRIETFTPGIYLTHNVDSARLRIIRLLRRLGHRAVAWDEEGLVFISEPLYRARRIDHRALALTDRFFAWGPQHAHALAPVAKDGGPAIVETGNPRADLLRREFRPLYEDAAARLVERYGSFILINSNFGWVNYALAQAGEGTGDEAALAAIARRSRFPLDYIRVRYAIFRAFQALLPALSQRFPQRRIVVRPHPSEDPAAWAAAADALGNVEVRYDEALIPWLLAADAIVHNGCTTAVEAALLGRSAIMYRPVDAGEWELTQPLSVSLEAADDKTLFDLIETTDRLTGLPAKQAETLKTLVGGLDGEPSAERIARDIATLPESAPAALLSRSIGAAQAKLRRAEKSLLGRRRTSPANPDYVSKKFPPMTAETLQARTERLAAQLGVACPRVRETSDRIFELAV